MNRIFVTAIVFSLALLSGCVGHYRYESHGSVLVADDRQIEAVIYWFGDDGRLWYGKRYRQVDSDVALEGCDFVPKSFDAAAGGDSALLISSKSGDSQVAEVNDAGGVVKLTQPIRLPPGSDCGRISVDMAAVLTSDLRPGVEPEVIILCKSVRSPQSFPAANLYRFDAIVRTKVDGNPPPTVDCSDD